MSVMEIVEIVIRNYVKIKYKRSAWRKNSLVGVTEAKLPNTL